MPGHMANDESMGSDWLLGKHVTRGQRSLGAIEGGVPVRSGRPERLRPPEMFIGEVSGFSLGLISELA